MALTSSTNNFILLPGLVPSNISPFLSICEHIKGQVNIIVVTESSSLENLSLLNDFPNLFVHSLTYPEEIEDQLSKACNRRLFQWYKFNYCLKILQQLEHKYSFVANRVFKLRFDYLFTNYRSLIGELLAQEPLADDLLFCESDRIFFGSRLTMFSLRHFLDVAVALFLHKPNYFYPIHHGNLGKSSLGVTRWERLNFDRRYFDCPSIHEFRSDPIYINSLLQNSPYPTTPPTPADIYSFHTGNLELPAERSFAWYLNVHGIIPRSHPSMAGGVYRC